MSESANDNHPKSLAEAVKFLLQRLEPDDIEAIRAMDKDSLAQLHHGLGTYIRNQFGLWSGNEKLMKSMKLRHLPADYASGLIIEALWKRLQKTAVNSRKKPKKKKL